MQLGFCYTLAIITMAKHAQSPKSRNGLIVTMIIMAALAMQLFIAFHFEGTGDTGAWRLIGKTGLHGQQYGVGNGTVYDGDCPALCGNWPPFTYHSYIITRWLYEQVNPFRFPDYGYYKLIPIGSSGLILYLIYKLALLYKLKNPLLLVFLYAFHPLSFYITAYHGQREVTWLALLLLSILLLQMKHYIWFAILYAGSVSVKIPPLLFAPFLFLKLPTGRNRVLFVVLLLLIFFVLNLPETVLYTSNVGRQVFLYPGIPSWWGLSGLETRVSGVVGQPSLAQLLLPLNKALLYASILIISVYFYFKKMPIIESCLGVLMTVFVFTPIYASEYMLWPLPFMVLAYYKYTPLFWFYSLFACFAAINTYGIFGVRILETLVLKLPQTTLYSTLLHLSIPWDLYMPLWIVCIIGLFTVAKRINHSASSSGGLR